MPNIILQAAMDKILALTASAQKNKTTLLGGAVTLVAISGISYYIFCSSRKFTGQSQTVRTLSHNPQPTLTYLQTRLDAQQPQKHRPNSILTLFNPFNLVSPESTPEDKIVTKAPDVYGAAPSIKNLEFQYCHAITGGECRSVLASQRVREPGW
jgi:hypothetical protein